VRLIGGIVRVRAYVRLIGGIVRVRAYVRLLGSSGSVRVVRVKKRLSEGCESKEAAV
jgi:hypothetical protein